MQEEEEDPARGPADEASGCAEELLRSTIENFHASAIDCCKRKHDSIPFQWMKDAELFSEESDVYQREES